MENYRLTSEGREKSNESRRLSMENTRAKKKAKQVEEIETSDFPPTISDKHNRDCLTGFINATSPTFLQTYECGICGEAVKLTENKQIDIQEIPAKELLSVEQSDEDNLEEYVHNNLLLSPGGIIDDNGIKTVNCCTTCLQYLQKKKLPPLSIANSFQIGRTPPELSDLTLPEKLLISVNRPKIHVIKLRSSSGPGTRQRGLIGNTITFPQNIVQIAESLPASPDILVDHLRVVFLGNTRPTHEALKKVLTVRRQKVFDAIAFLIANNPLYSDVTLSTVDLPENDIPEQILETLHMHEDENDEDACEHSTYTPQTDVNDVPSDTVLMDSTGMIDMEGSSVRSDDQMNSAINALQGTMYVPHGSMPVNEYNNPNLWLGSYPWLFPYGKGGPEIER